jgi:hypothetical protein
MLAMMIRHMVGEGGTEEERPKQRTGDMAIESSVCRRDRARKKRAAVSQAC